ncbi:BUD13 homolog [Paramacrobiotus metropolitanus]|uniref:BUD13 homolog n=1 Tax=Paramacrobiotus metropolitanus TaxID=2943436 RepID=UPI0024463C4F|nr:BUD13 homolog [Paramacrobiotus metropolitanus]
MASSSKLDYLKRYMSKDDADNSRKKKKKKPVLNPHATSGITIVDKDLDVGKRSVSKFEDDPYGDSAPTVAEIIDDTIPVGMQDSSKWKAITRTTSSPPRSRIKEESPDLDLPRPSGRSRRRPLSDDDLSPIRAASDQRRRSDRDEDLSPVRRRGQESAHIGRADDDLSPARSRPRHSDHDLSPVRRSEFAPSSSRRDDDHSPPRRSAPLSHSSSRDPVGIPGKTLSGRTAGLQNARTLREETDRKRREEDDMFRRMDADISGRGAATVYRDRKTGKKRDFAAEDEEAAEKAARQKAHEEKFRKWGKGLAQQEKHDQAVQDALHEMSKPLARYVDDSDRDAFLKAQDREGDPMLEYLSKKRNKTQGDAGERPKYKGAPPPPNRFGIPPGYRWDGVDRSNGFEKERFKRSSNKIASAADAYKWSTEDM